MQPVEEADAPAERGWRDGYVLTLIVGFVAFCLGPSLVGARTLLSVNLLSNFEPWMAVQGDQLIGHETCQGDTVDSVMPGIARFRADLYAGHFANWQGVVGGGSNLGGIPDLGMFDPLSLPYWFLPLWLAPAFVALIQIIVAVGGTFLFLRQFRLSRAAGLIGGLVFATSGFMVMWNNWPQTRVAALIPALFWGVERLIRRRRLRDMPLIAAVVASMLLGGFPEVTGFAIYLAGGYLLVRVAASHREHLRDGVRTIGLAAGGLVLGLLIAMAQMLPFVYFFAHSDLGYRSGDGNLGLPLSGLLTLFAPSAYGLCIDGQANHGAVNPVELVAFIGSAALILAITGAAFGYGRSAARTSGQRGLRGYFVAATTVIVLLTYISPSLRRLDAHLPIFSGNFIGRIRSVLGFGLAVLAAVGFERVTRPPAAPTLDGPRAGRSRRAAWTSWAWAALVVIVVAIVGLVALRHAHRDAFVGGYEPALRNALIVPGILLVAAAVVVVGRALTGNRTLAFVVLPLLVVTQSAQFFHAVLPGDNPAYFYPDTPTHQFLAAHLGGDRFTSVNRTMYTPTALFYGLRTPTGHTFEESQWITLLKQVDPAVMATPTFSDFSPSLTGANAGDQPILDLMAVKYLVLPDGDLAGHTAALPAAQGQVPADQDRATCTMAGGPLRGVTVELAAPVTSRGRAGVTLEARVSTGAQTAIGADYVGTSVPAGTQVSIPLAGEELAGGVPVQVTIWASGAKQALLLAAAGGQAACAPVTPVADGLRLVDAGAGAVTYQRLTSLPRIRWDSQSVVIGNPSQEVKALDQGVPGNEVVLGSEGPQASGQPATVDVVQDTDGHITARVDAQGAGYLTVADAVLQPGWTATVDGRSVPVVAADLAMGAVAVPAGSHIVRLEYHTPGQSIGLALSAIGVVATLALIGLGDLDWRRIARRRRDDAE